jgi:hypothetical protein
MRRENLREQLRSLEYLRQIHIILDKLDEVRDELTLKIMNTKLQSYFKLLQKTLPDVKAVEVDAIVTEAPKDRAGLEQQLVALGIDPETLSVHTEH